MDILELRRGSTYTQVVRWGAGPIVYKPITGISQSAPVVITAPSHAIPNGWPVAIVSVKGMKEINAKSTPPLADPDPYKSDYKQATVLTPDTVSLNLVNSSDYTAYASGGYVQYFTPVDLAGYTARMKGKDKNGNTLFSLTDAAGIVIDNVDKTIVFTITDAVTEVIPLSVTKGTFDLELVSPSGTVTALMAGVMTISKETTTP